MEKETTYPVCRNLDRVYRRVERNGEPLNICFSDLTLSEKEDYLNTLAVVGLKELAIYLADTLYEIGCEFDIVRIKK